MGPARAGKGCAPKPSRAHGCGCLPSALRLLCSSGLLHHGIDLILILHAKLEGHKQSSEQKPCKRRRDGRDWTPLDPEARQQGTPSLPLSALLCCLHLRVSGRVAIAVRQKGIAHSPNQCQPAHNTARIHRPTRRELNARACADLKRPSIAVGSASVASLPAGRGSDLLAVSRHHFAELSRLLHLTTRGRKRTGDSRSEHARERTRENTGVAASQRRSSGVFAASPGRVDKSQLRCGAIARIWADLEVHLVSILRFDFEIEVLAGGRIAGRGGSILLRLLVGHFLREGREEGSGGKGARGGKEREGRGLSRGKESIKHARGSEGNGGGWI